ncbi:MAG: minor capsid protein [Bacteroidetes bacterium]|nr:minor capsid protein [Bacteroidota bacterium]
MCVDCGHIAAVHAPENRLNTLEFLNEYLHKTGATPEQLSEGIVLAQTRDIMEAIVRDAGGRIDPRKLAGYELNVFAHSSFKTYRMLQEAEILRKTATGAELETSISELNKIYTDYYHAAEKQLARQVAREIEHWEEIDEMKDLLPYLTFHAIIDERTRDSHAALDGFTFRVDDPNRKKYTPPLDYNCRCFLTQEFEPPEGSTIVAPKDFKPKPTFERDYRKNKRIFTDKMPFMNQARSEEMGLTPVRFENRQLFKPMNQVMSKMLPKLQHGWEEEITENGGKIMTHLYAKPLAKEIEQIRSILKKGDTIHLLPKLEQNVSQNFKNFKNTDAFLNGKLLEMKKQSGSNLASFIQNAFRDAKKQNTKILVLSPKSFDKNTFSGRLSEGWKNSGIEEMVLILDHTYTMTAKNFEQVLESIKPK